MTSWWRALHPARERELSERVDVLTRTRRGALDAQDAELRRIERDLHDGAQARLVALSMQLGRAEDRLDDAPRGRRAGPQRARRGLATRSRSCATSPAASPRRCSPTAACRRRSSRSASARRCRSRSTRGSQRRLSPVVESAAYFVVAESLTNAAKYARGARREGHAAGGARAPDRRDRRRRPRRRRPAGQRPERAAQPRRGARWHPGRPKQSRGGDDRARRAAVRVVIVEDQALLREGIVALLREKGIDVVAQAEDGPGLLRILAGHKPDLAIVDVRLPPTFTDEGIRAALEARAQVPGPRRADPVPVRRAGLHRRAAGLRRGRDRLPAQGARRRRQGVRRRGRERRARRDRARPRGRLRARAPPRPGRRRRRAGRA